MAIKKLSFQSIVLLAIVLLYGVQGCSGVRTLRLKEARTLQADSTYMQLGMLSALPPPALIGDTLGPERQIPILLEFTVARGFTDRLELGATAWMSGPLIILTVLDFGIEPYLTLMLSPRESSNTWSILASGSFHHIFGEGFTTNSAHYSNRTGSTTTFGGGLQYQRQLSYSKTYEPLQSVPETSRFSTYGNMMLRKIQGDYHSTLKLSDSTSTILSAERSLIAITAGIGIVFGKNNRNDIVEVGVTIPLNVSFERDPWIISIGFTSFLSK